MDKIFNHEKHENSIYNFWETNGFFKAEVNTNKKPFSIILPPANANGNLHMGHAMFVYEDVMIRYNKMKGNEVLWLPGLDHAGIETQYVFEKELKKKGKSRFDFNREDLYRAISDFTNENKTKIKSQLRKLGFALDWSREKFTMDKDIIDIVYDTFKKLYDEGLVYRDKKLVNYCIKDGTSFSDLEVEDKEVVGKLYFVKFPLVDGGFITVATTRPETILGDVAVAVNPKDKRFKKLDFLKKEITKLNPVSVYGRGSNLLISYGSTKGAILDALPKIKNFRFLQISYLSPLPAEIISREIKKSKKVILVENGVRGALADVIKQETGLTVKYKILKYDGRPFTPEFLIDKLKKI